MSTNALPIRTLEPGSREYPSALAELPDAPERLHVLGALPESRRVAVVGARAASGHNMAVAHALGADLARAGFTVVSGGAIGIDGAAHRGALEAGGATAAVLATGVDVAYPSRHRPLFDRIVGSGRGALVSPFPLGVPPRKYRFVRRNRIVAGLCEAVVVVEASAASGALYTARAARDYGRVLGAHPGTPGCEALIAERAAVIECAADVVAALDGSPRRPDVSVPAEGTAEWMVLAALNRELARGEDDLSAATGLAARSVSRALMGLELEGLAVPLPGRAYLRSGLAEDLLAR